MSLSVAAFICLVSCLMIFLNKKIVAYFLIGIYCVFIMSRPLSVPDTLAYADFFNEVQTGNMISLDYFYFEPGFQMYTHLVKFLLRGKVAFYFATIVLTNIGLLLWSVRRFTGERLDAFQVILLVTLYFAFFGYYYNAIVLRAGLAMSLLIASASVLYKKKLTGKEILLGIFFCVLAWTFHISSVIGIVALLIIRYSRRMTQSSYLLSWLVVFTLFFAGFSAWLLTTISDFLFSNVYLLEGTSFEKMLYYADELAGIKYILPYRVMFQIFAGLLFIFPPVRMPSLYYKWLNVYFFGLFVTTLFCAVEQLARITDFFLIYSVFLFWMYFREVVRQRIPYFTLFMGVAIFQLMFVFRIINK